MTFKDGKIISCTKDELRWIYLDQDWDELYTFDEYLKAMVTNGVVIMEDKNDSN